MTKQNTLAHSISCSGVGLHSGSQVNLTLRPAAPDTGIMFKRLDVTNHPVVAARYDAVCETRLGTTITNANGVKVSTVEHLVAALWGAGIDNVMVELDGPEVPIMDGSSEPFTFLIECAGVQAQSAPRKIIRIVKPIKVREGLSMAHVSPNCEGDDGCVLDIYIEYDSKVIQSQCARYDFRDVSFKQALSRARTFGFLHEVEAMRQHGLALGGSLDNAIVVDRENVINKEGLRYTDEFVRHKALDCLGDLYLAGYRIDGHFSFSRPGHGINNALLRAIFADSDAYVIVREDEAIESPISASAYSAAAFV